MPLPTVTLTPQAILLLNLLIQNAITLAFNKVSGMTPEEIAKETPIQEARNKTLTEELYGH